MPFSVTYTKKSCQLYLEQELLDDIKRLKLIRVVRLINPKN